MDTPKTSTRSACDRCRAKRVRCPRGENSTGSCTRCIRVGERCVTGAAGHPGRPRKARLVDSSMPRDLAMTPVSGSSPGCRSTLPDSGPSELQTPAAEDSMSVDTEWFGGGTLLNGLGEAGLELLEPAVQLSQDTSFDGDPESCTAPDGPNLFASLLTEEYHAPASDSIPTLMDQLSNPSQHLELLRPADSLDMIYSGQNSNEMLSIDSFLDASEYLSNPSLVQCPSAASSLMRFQEKMEQRVSAMGSFFLDPHNVVEGCKQSNSMGTTADNPVAVVLTCTKEFIDILQNLTTETRPAASSQLASLNTEPCNYQSKPLSTETALLVLSSYIALMRLYDSLFHGVSRCFGQQQLENIKSMKVKAVFRIGGMSSLQDMPLKAYAAGIIDVIQSQIQTLERHMGVPAAYCLSSEVTASQSTGGIFSNGDRARLFHTVMTQEDVRSHGGKSYVESIRETIKTAMAFLGD
ncbi:hypothetical protein F5Y03DRAFT_195371 [Xylaria venustula]|nr:hypothetical protein F5Y03DRAFT_195371 [Xylaria venustula]